VALGIGGSPFEAADPEEWGYRFRWARMREHDTRTKPSEPRARCQ